MNKYHHVLEKGITELNDVMGAIKISGKEHYIHECQAWSRALEYFLQENAYMKTRLSQVVDTNTDKNFVDLAEHFQNGFLLNDEFIKDLLVDIRKQQETLKKMSDNNTLGSERLINKSQVKLRNEMQHFEKKFSLMKDEFNQYLVSHL